MAAPTLVQTATAGATGASSAGSVTVTATVALGSNTTTGNKLVITIQSKTNILNGNRGILPTSGNYNATLNSSYTNVGSSSNPQGGFDCISAHNKTSTSIYMQTWCFYATVSSGAAFSETFNFESDHTGTFGIVPHFSITVEEWSGLDSVVGGTGDLQNNVQDTFGISQTGVSFADDDILAMHHYCDNDPDDDSIVTVGASTSGVTKSNSTNITGNIRREAYKKTVSAGSTFSITYDDDAGSNGGNLAKVVQVLKLVAATSTTHQVTSSNIDNTIALGYTNVNKETQFYGVPYLGSADNASTVVLKFDRDTSSGADVNGFSGGVWNQKVSYNNTNSSGFGDVLKSFEYADSSNTSAVQDIWISSSNIIQAPNVDSDDVFIGYDFSATGFIQSGPVVRDLVGLNATAVGQDVSEEDTGMTLSGATVKALENGSTTPPQVAFNQTLTVNSSQDCTVFIQLGTVPTSGVVYPVCEQNTSSSASPAYYSLTTRGSSVRTDSGQTFGSTTQMGDNQLRVLRVESGAVTERVNGTATSMSGTMTSNFDIEGMYQAKTAKTTSNSTAGLQIVEMYVVDYALDDASGKALEKMEAYFAQKYSQESSYPSGHLCQTAQSYTAYDHNPSYYAAAQVFGDWGGGINQTVTGPVIVTLGKAVVSNTCTVTLEFVS